MTKQKVREAFDRMVKDRALTLLAEDAFKANPNQPPPFQLPFKLGTPECDQYRRELLLQAAAEIENEAGEQLKAILEPVS